MEPKTQYTRLNNAIKEKGRKCCLMIRERDPSGLWGKVQNLCDEGEIDRFLSVPVICYQGRLATLHGCYDNGH
jgi:hypothetical protein